MTTGEKIALFGAVIAFLAFAATQVYRWLDRQVRVKAKAFPHIVPGPDGKPLLHGMGIELTSVGGEPAEIVNVRIRLHGVDVTASFMEAYSGSQLPTTAPQAKPSDTGIEIPLRLEENGKLLINDKDSEAQVVKLAKNHSLRFFTPLPFQPVDIQLLFDDADDDQVSIVAHILPEKDRTLLRGSQVMECIRTCLKAHRGKPFLSGYPWGFRTFTIATAPPDTWAMGKHNDKHLVIKDRTEKPRPRVPPSRDDWPDVWVADWRCEALHEVHSNLQELMAVPRGKGYQFHPQEVIISDEEVTNMRGVFADAIRSRTDFLMTLATFDPRSVTIRFSHHGTAAVAMFSYDVNGEPSHAHGFAVMLPRINPDDDKRAVEFARQFAYLKEIRVRDMKCRGDCYNRW